MGKVGIEGWWHAWLHACGQEVGMKNVVQREKGGDMHGGEYAPNSEREWVW